jgi:glucose-6-phosphate isomerase, archaeal
MLDRALDPALDVSLCESSLSFRYGPGVSGPDPEFRTLDAIRGSLLDPQCSGPTPSTASRWT